MIRQLTDGPHINHPTYFLQSSFFPGDREMFFTSYRTGDAQLFEISLGSGETRQLTQRRAHPSVLRRRCTPMARPWSSRGAGNCGRSPAPRSKSAASSPSPARNSASAPSVPMANGSRRPLRRTRRGAWWSAALTAPDSTIIPFPRTVIHPQFHPLEPEWIEFSGDPAPRMHRVRRDGTGLECLYQHGNDEFIVHETFLGSTRRPGVHGLAARSARDGLDHARDAHHRRVQRLAHRSRPRRPPHPLRHQPSRRRTANHRRTIGRAPPAVPHGFEQPGLAVAQIQLRAGGRFRPGAQHAELDGECRRYGLRSAAHAPASQLEPRRIDGDLRQRPHAASRKCT